MKTKRFLDEEEQPKKKQNKQHYTKSQPVIEEDDSAVKEELLNARVDNKAIFGFLADYGKGKIVVKWDKRRDKCILISSDGVGVLKDMTQREYNTDKALYYQDEIF